MTNKQVFFYSVTTSIMLFDTSLRSKSDSQLRGVASLHRLAMYYTRKIRVFTLFPTHATGANLLDNPVVRDHCSPGKSDVRPGFVFLVIADCHGRTPLQYRGPGFRRNFLSTNKSEAHYH